MPKAECSKTVILPEEFDVIARTFKRLCRAADVDTSSSSALTVATRTLGEFQNGRRSPEELLHSVALSPEYRALIIKHGAECSQAPERGRLIH